MISEEMRDNSPRSNVARVRLTRLVKSRLGIAQSLGDGRNFNLRDREIEEVSLNEFYLEKINFFFQVFLS